MKILVAYGTLSGNTQVVAESIGQYLVSKGYEVDIKNQDEIEPDAMSQYPFVFLGGSTWGDGESNPSTVAFIAKIVASQATFPSTKFAIFGLGETNYANFCAVVDHLDEALKAKNATVIGEKYKIDGYPDEEVLSRAHAWADTILVGT